MNPVSFAYLADLLKSRSGIVLTQDKLYLLETRLLPIARAHGETTLDGFVPLLKRPGAESLINEVIEAMTTNETFFYRDKTPFDRLTDTILPALHKSRPNKTLNVWCAAASSGQEPYSIAMTIKESGLFNVGWNVRIVGTDLSKDILDKAKAGTYTQFEVQRGLPVQLMLKYFTQDGDKWHISQDIKRMVQFKPYNLLDPFTSLGKFDIVFIRNVLIYFDRETKADILARTSKVLADDGYMLLGAAETVVGITTDFEPVKDKRGIYQKSGHQAAVSSPASASAAPLRVVA